jgi:hypothetical protein
VVLKCALVLISHTPHSQGGRRQARRGAEGGDYLFRISSILYPPGAVPRSRAARPAAVGGGGSLIPGAANRAAARSRRATSFRGVDAEKWWSGVSRDKWSLLLAVRGMGLASTSSLLASLRASWRAVLGVFVPLLEKSGKFGNNSMKYCVHLLLNGCSNYYARGKEVRLMQTRSGVEVYRQADAARRLKVSRTTITRMIRSGELATVDQDGFRLVTSESLRVAQAKRNKLLKLGIG